MFATLVYRTLRLSILSLTPLGVAVAQPTWSSIMPSGASVNYELYATSSTTETTLSTPPWLGSGTGLTSTPRPPRAYQFATIDSSYNFSSGPSATSRSVCPASTSSYPQNLSNTNWSNWVGSTAWQENFYDPSQFIQSGSNYLTYPVLGESSSTASLSGVKGLQFTGSFNGPATPFGSGVAVETVFVSDNPCTAGNNEYGFSVDTASAAPTLVTFYYSAYTNCGGNCYQTTGYATQNTGVNVNLGITLTQPNILSNYTFTYQAYLTPDTASSSSEDYAFVVQVIDPYTGSPTQCKFNGGTTQSCSTTVHIDPTKMFSNFADIIAGGSYDSGTGGGSTTFSGESYMTAYAGTGVLPVGGSYPSMSSYCSGNACYLYVYSLAVGQ